MGRTAVLLMAYGSPRRREDIAEYYTDIRRGRPPSAEQLADLVERYDAIGGVSPLAERTEAQAARLQACLDERRPGAFEVVVALKHAPPRIEGAVATLPGRGIGRAVALVLAPHYSALSVGEYLARAADAARRAGVALATVESWHLEPAYVEFLTRGVCDGLGRLPEGSAVVFSAHSLPARVLDLGDPYPAQVRATAAAVAQRCGLDAQAWTVAWQSAARTPEPWLEPDLPSVIDALAHGGTPGVLVCAAGFVADHLEVLYDLDVQARDHAARHGLAFARTPSVNDDPGVIGALADLVLERAA